MQYLTIEDIKVQIRYESDFNEDNHLLEVLGDGAEAFLAEYLDESLDEVSARNGGKLPANLYNALLIMVSYLVDNDGSGENRDIPQAFYVFAYPYKNYSVA